MIQAQQLHRDTAEIISKTCLGGSDGTSVGDAAGLCLKATIRSEGVMTMLAAKIVASIGSGEVMGLGKSYTCT